MRLFLLTAISLVIIFFAVALIGKINRHVEAKYLADISYKGKAVLYEGTPEDYVASPHVELTAIVDEAKNYQISFKFKGHKKRDWHWKWAYPEEQTDRAILKFGIPKSLFEPYYPVDSVIRKRNQQMSDGMFFQDGRYLRPDMNKMIQYYKPFLEPVATLTQNAQEEENTWRDMIEMLMKFCQDIPYGVPPKYFNDKYIGGLFPPPQVFANGFGDCDSKAVIFCSAASYFRNTEMVLLFETGHVLPAVKGIPKPYDTFYTYKNEKYIMADTAGPGRNGLGMTTDPYQKINKVLEVN